MLAHSPLPFNSAISLIDHFSDYFPTAQSGEGKSQRVRHHINLTRLMGLLSLLSMQILNVRFHALHTAHINKLTMPQEIDEAKADLASHLQEFEEYGDNYQETANKAHALSLHIRDASRRRQDGFAAKLNSVIDSISNEKIPSDLLKWASLLSAAHTHLRSLPLVLSESWAAFEQEADLTLVSRLAILETLWQHKNIPQASHMDFFRKALALLQPRERTILLTDPVYCAVAKWVQFENDAKFTPSQIHYFNELHNAPCQTKSDITLRHVKMFQKLSPEQQAVYQSEIHYAHLIPWISFVMDCEKHGVSLMTRQAICLDALIVQVNEKILSPVFYQLIIAAHKASSDQPLLSPQQLRYFTQYFRKVNPVNILEEMDVESDGEMAPQPSSARLPSFRDSRVYLYARPSTNASSSALATSSPNTSELMEEDGPKSVTLPTSS